MKRLVGLLIVIFFTGRSLAQDTLPHFTIVERGDKVVISWVNPYEKVVQLNVQRSFEGGRNFSTIYSATSPELPQNGFTDIRMPTNRIFYRIFYVLEGGTYFFSVIKRVGTATDYTASRDIKNPNLFNANANDKRIVTIKIKDTTYSQIPASSFRAFRDSVLRLTKDTLFAVNDSLVMLNPYVAREAFRASMYVFVNRDGLINLSLPLANNKKYELKFFEENGTPLLEINNLKESPLILDKSNFIHAGWFLFELYEDNKLKEKNRFYVPRDF